MKQNSSKSRAPKSVSKVGLIGEGAFNADAAELKIEGIKERTAYSGGFKVPENRAHNQTVMQQSRQHTRPEKEEILRQLGVTNQLTYQRESELPQTKVELQDKLVDSIEAKLERIRFQRAKLLDSGLKNLKADITPSAPVARDPNIMKIYESKERVQVAYQEPSTLQAMTLENIEAQLEAHRISLKPLQERFFQKRGRSPPANRLSVQQQVEAEKKNLIYAIKRPEEAQLLRKRAIDEQELQRLFEEKKKTDPKLAEYDAKYKEYQIQKLAKKGINSAVKQILIKPSWDKYKQEANKSKSKERAIEKSSSKPKGGFLPLSDSPKAVEDTEVNAAHVKKAEEQDRLEFLEEKYSLEKIVLSKNDRYIMKYIFKILDPNRHGVISKEELFEFCMAQEIIRKDFGIDEKWFYSDLDTFPTKRKGILQQEECLEFLSVQRMLKHEQIELIDPNELRREAKKNVKAGLQLSDNQLKMLEEVFKSLDPHEDRLVKREDLIDSMYMDPEVGALLDRPAIHIEVVGKSITLRQILELVLSEYRIEKNPKIKKAKQYITFNQFMDFFRRWEGLQLSSLDVQTKPRTVESELFDIYPDYLQLLLDTFNTVPRVYQDFICTKDFLQLCRKDPQIQSIGEELCRIDSVETGLKLENVALVLKRMYAQTDEYASWSELKQFFSRRGRPIGWDADEINLRKELRLKKKAEAEAKLQSTQSRLKKKFETQQSFGLEVHKTTLKQAAALAHAEGKYTVPEPFPITDMIKQKNTKLNEEGKTEFEELREGIKALPLNKEILEPKLEKIEKKRQERSRLNKEESKKRTIETEKPFSFYEKEVISKIMKEAAIKELQKKKIEEQEANLVKAADIDAQQLKKTYKQVMKEGEEKRKSKKPTTDFQVSENLYPKDPTQIERDKAKKVLEKIEKLEEVEARHKQQLERQKKEREQKRKKKEDILKKKMKRDEEEQKEKDQIARKAAGATFKPEINSDFKPDPNSKDAKKERQEKKQNERIEQFIKAQEEKRRKIRQFQPKEEPKIDVNELDDDEILDKLSDIDFEDLLVEEDVKSAYKRMKEFEAIPFSNRRKLNRDRRNAMMGRERKQMEAEEKRRRQEIIERINKERKQREQSREKIVTGQLERTKDKKIDVNTNTFEGGFAFHKSRALRRYRDIMDGRNPLSEYDRMSNQPSVKKRDFQKEAEELSRLSRLSNSTIKEQ